MKITKPILSAILLAGAALTSGIAIAADVSHAAKSLNYLDGTRDYGDSFASGLSGATFADQYTFSLSGPYHLNSLVSSISDNAALGLEVTGFTLKGAMGSTYSGVRQLAGEVDLWSLKLSNLAADSYTLTVSGKINSAGSASYAGNINIAAVPEPETYALMMAGLGLVGFAARRRKAASFKA